MLPVEMQIISWIARFLTVSHGDFRSVLGGQAESEFFQSYGREIESQLMNSVAKIRQRLMQDPAQIQGQGANWIGFVPL